MKSKCQKCGAEIEQVIGAGFLSAYRCNSCGWTYNPVSMLGPRVKPFADGGRNY